MISKKHLKADKNNWPVTDERLQKLKEVLKNRQSGLTVIMEHVDDPHNIAAVLRTCDAVGIYEVFVIDNQQNSSRHLGRRSSASAMKWIKVHHFEKVSDCLQEVRKKYPLVYCTHLSTKAQSVYDMNFMHAMAIAFGNEHAGISDELLSAADGNIIIPQAGMVPSLNISVACAVILYESYRQRLKGHYAEKHPLSEAEQIDLLKSFTSRKVFEKDYHD